jgi:excinuclease ABC subunit A
MEVSDHLIDLGPFAGENGGQLVYQGGIRDVMNNGISTLTAAYLKGEKVIPPPAQPRKGSGTCLLVKNAREHNLKSINVSIPLGKLVAVTGVSGSGKSTLVHDVIYAGLAKKFDKWQKHVGRHDDITGVDNIDDVVLVDQSPIGRTPRSNPATYTKAYDGIRKLFAQTRQAQLHGLTAGSFSFNTVGGRCERCGGAGQETVEMQFLADVQLTCEQCDGRRFRQEVLEIRYNGKNISEVLDLQVSEAVTFFEGKRNITNRLKLLDEVGLGYLRLGQSSVTLSGGEAQRVKLASHLAEKSNRHILYIFDEPTTGLHFYDIAVLMKCLDKIIDRGNSVLIVEHNLDVIKCADHIIDLGPEGGDRGGEVIATGSPAGLAESTESHTGIYLKKYLQS